jgi:tRNA A-37 threonylcarbamoyl transferase component Bud32
LIPYGDQLKNDLWQILENPKSEKRRRLLAASSLAAYDADSPRWQNASQPTAECLVAENPLVIGMWLEALRPVRRSLLPALRRIFPDEQRPEYERLLAAEILGEYGAGDPDVLVELIRIVDAEQFSILLPRLMAHGSRAASLLKAELAKSLPPGATDDMQEDQVKGKANVGVALLHIGERDKVWPLLKHNRDPSLRSYLIERLKALSADPGVILKHLEEETEVSVRQSLLLSLGEFGDDRLPPQQRAIPTNAESAANCETSRQALSDRPPVQHGPFEPPEPPANDSGPPSAPIKCTARDAGVPEKLGRFEVQQRLGAGAFGAVYRAYDPMLDREVAVKVPHASTLQSATRRARVLTEAKAAAQLRHPNIVPVYEAGKDGDTYYIASAFIDGRTLEDAMAQRTFDFRQATKLVMDLAGALHYAHQRGVVHRDIKPANIMLDAQGDPLVMDFGLARLETAESKLTHDGTVLGTPAYMPPEQASGHLDQVGPASDQYSLGVVLYELLCGETPFSGPPTMVISLVINQEPDSPRKTNPSIPKDLETTCLKAMSKKREHRYPNCQELAEDLRRGLAGEPIQARRVSPAERLVRWCRRNPIVAGLAGVAALLVILVAVVASIGYASTSQALGTAKTEWKRAEDALGREARERQQAEIARGRNITDRARKTLTRKIFLPIIFLP